MSEYEERQEVEANQIPQEPETSEALSEEDLESIAGGVNRSTFTKVKEFDNKGRLDSVTTTRKSWNNSKKCK